MVKLLDDSRAVEIADMILDSLEDAGYSVEEIIPGLIQGVIDISNDDDALLDQAANFLADGGVET